MSRENCGKQRPPTIDDVKIYFSQKGLPEYEAENFYELYQKKEWISRYGNFLKNWKDVAYKWIVALVHQQPFLFDRHIH